MQNLSTPNVLRSLVGILGAATLTASIFYGAAGPDPRADLWTSTPAAQMAVQTSGSSAA